MLKRTGLFFILLYLVSLSSLSAQQTGLSPKDIFKIRQAGESVLSPDGKFIAYTVSVPRKISDGVGSDFRELFVYDFGSKRSKQLLQGKVSIGQLSWTPDSKSIAFKAKLDKHPQSQVYTISPEGGEAAPLTDISVSFSQYQFTPDGKSLLYVSETDRFPELKELKKKGFDAEFYEETYDDVTLFVYNISNKESRKLTNNISVFDFEISPDGKSVAALMAPKNLVDDSYMLKRVFIIDIATGNAKKIVDDLGKITKISWSPDSKHLAFVAGSDIQDPVSGSLFITNVSEIKKLSELKNYTLTFEGSVKSCAWLDANTVVYNSDESVDITLRSVKIGSDKSELLLQGGNAVFQDFSVSGKLVTFAGSTKEHPAELFWFNTATKELGKLSRLNQWLDDVKLAKQERIVYNARDGLRIEGTLIYPLNFKEGNKYPLICTIHGGPESSVPNGWVTNYNSWGQFAAAKDYFVFIPNYRASAGRGIAYAKADRGDLAGPEFDDVLDGIDYLVKKGWVDRSKVGIGGGSYGGYFSAWGATKHTEHFAASVVFVGVSNQISKSHTTDIPYEDYHVHWGIWPYENFDLYMNRSPVKYSQQSKTPTLILHGKDDPRVPVMQSVELYRTLKLHSKAPVRFVQYPGEGHGNRKNTSRLDYLVRTLAWFDYYLKSDSPKDQMPPMILDFSEFE